MLPGLARRAIASLGSSQRSRRGPDRGCQHQQKRHDDSSYQSSCGSSIDYFEGSWHRLCLRNSTLGDLTACHFGLKLAAGATLEGEIRREKLPSLWNLALVGSLACCLAVWLLGSCCAHEPPR